VCVVGAGWRPEELWGKERGGGPGAILCSDEPELNWKHRIERVCVSAMSSCSFGCCVHTVCGVPLLPTVGFSEEGLEEGFLGPQCVVLRGTSSIWHTTLERPGKLFARDG